MSNKLDIKLRDYQQECVDVIDGLDSGAYLVTLATGLGKTVIFTHIARRGRVLIISHRDELVRQPVKYYDVPVGIEKGSEHSDGEEVVSATVQTLSRDKRLNAFKPGDFDIVITDEAHHAAAPSYRRIIEHLKPRLHVGFTATPKRGDKRGLEKVFSDIVFARDLKWGIKNGYLADIDAQRVDVSWDTRKIRTQNGDFALAELGEEVNKPHTNDQIAQAYREFAEGPTLVFASSVEHAYQLAKRIPNSAVVDAKLPLDERRAIIEAFAAGELDCLINFGIFTEGTDLPMIRTILLARPTKNETLYAQMVGRGLRLDPDRGKTCVKLIDCVGLTTDANLCTAPTLFGLNEKDFPKNARKVINGRLSTLEERLAELEDTPAGWLLRAHKVNVLDDQVAWTTLFDGSKVVQSDKFSVTMTAPDPLGGVDVRFVGNKTTLVHFANEDQATARVADWLARNPLSANERYIWDAKQVGTWGAKPASQSQIDYIKQLVGSTSGLDLSTLTKRDAAIVITNAKQKRENESVQKLGRCPLCGAPLTRSRNGGMVQCSKLRWRKTEEDFEAQGACNFHFIPRVKKRRLSDAEIAQLFRRGFVFQGDHEYQLERSFKPGFAFLEKAWKIPGNLRVRPWRDPEVESCTESSDIPWPSFYAHLNKVGVFLR